MNYLESIIQEFRNTRESVRNETKTTMLLVKDKFDQLSKQNSDDIQFMKDYIDTKFDELDETLVKVLRNQNRLFIISIGLALITILIFIINLSK